MAESVADLLAQLERFLPPRYAAIRPHLAGIAAMFARAEAAGDDAGAAMTIDGAEGAFLRLYARGHGIYPQPGESDDSIRARMRNVENQVTRVGILRAVNALLGEFTGDTATMLERKEGPTLDIAFVLGRSRLADAHNSFVLVVPVVGSLYGGTSALGACTADGGTRPLVLGAGESLHPVYLAIRALVLRIKAAGIRAYLAVDA